MWLFKIHQFELMCVFCTIILATYPELLRKTMGHCRIHTFLQLLSAVWTSWNCPYKNLNCNSTSGVQGVPHYLIWGLTLKPLFVVSGYGTFMHMAHFTHRAFEHASFCIAVSAALGNWDRVKPRTSQ